MNKIIDLNNHTTLEALKKLFEFLQIILNEKQYRLTLAAFAIFLGWGAVTFLHELTGASKRRIIAGKREIENDDEIIYSARIRREGGGRKRKEYHESNFMKRVKEILDLFAYGDPASAKVILYSSISLVKLQARLALEGIKVCAGTVLRAVRDLGYSKQQNKKLLQVGKRHPDQDKQMKIIGRILKPRGHARCRKGKNPILSVDTKAKVLLGNIQQSGREYRKQKDPRKVNDHDFIRSEDRLPPYGIYDVACNLGFVGLGASHSTAQFAVQNIRRWWYEFGKDMYRRVDRIVIFCDGGGSNSSTGRLWKLELARLAEEIGLPIEVHHFPPGCSKYNPIEHRLFNHISMNWAGKPFTDRQTVLNYISSTTTSTGLVVRAWSDEQTYKKGIEVSEEEYDLINIERHPRLGNWNYTIHGLRSPDTEADA